MSSYNFVILGCGVLWGGVSNLCMWRLGSFHVPYRKQPEQWQHSCLPSFNLDHCIRHRYEDLCTRFKYLPCDILYYSCTRSILLMAEIGVFCWYLLITDQQLDLNILFPTHCCDCFWGEGVTSIMEHCAKGLAINFVGSYYTLICQHLSICSLALLFIPVCVFSFLFVSFFPCFVLSVASWGRVNLAVSSSSWEWRFLYSYERYCLYVHWPGCCILQRCRITCLQMGRKEGRTRMELT